MNKVLLSGRVIKVSAELKPEANNKVSLWFLLKVTDASKDDNIQLLVAWDSVARSIYNNLSYGDSILMEGVLGSMPVQDASGKIVDYRKYVHCHYVEFTSTPKKWQTPKEKEQKAELGLDQQIED